ncbi:Hypothetical predicted protein [Octopus vulgaris]|uniref:cGMP-dependent protein kinase 1-like n=2 Tax=Octopus TaxID=6643 RepID=A0AA36F4Z0_OCTVU|nr:Hypothetical predicted protein [Octopus vulgaris]
MSAETLEDRLRELKEILVTKEIIIHNQKKKLNEKDHIIEELRSQLDKYQSVLPLSTAIPTCVVAGPRKVRAQGISAEPQVLGSLHEFSNLRLRKHSKTYQ